MVVELFPGQLDILAEAGGAVVVDDAGSYLSDVLVSVLREKRCQHETRSAKIMFDRTPLAAFRSAVAALHVVGAGPAAFDVDDDQIDRDHPEHARIGLQLYSREIAIGVFGRQERVRRFRDRHGHLVHDVEATAGGERAPPGRAGSGDHDC